MVWVTAAINLARSIFEGIASLFGGGGVTIQELNKALGEAVDEMVDRTYIGVYQLIEYQDLKDAQANLGTAEDFLQAYMEYEAMSTKEKSKLDSAEDFATLAWNQLEEGVNLIAPPPGPNWTNQVGEGLLGHPSFLLAASFRLKILEEWIHYWEGEGLSDKAEAAKNILRQEIQEAITIARAMEDEWADFTRRRFTTLVKKLSTVPSGYPVEWAITGPPDIFPVNLSEIKLRVRWIYYFNGAKIIAKEVIWERGQNQDKIQQGYEDAVNVRLGHIERELNRVREGFVTPSEEVRGEWAKALFELGPQKQKMADDYLTIEKAMEATGSFHDPLVKTYFETHPEATKKEPAKPWARARRSLASLRRS